MTHTPGPWEYQHSINRIHIVSAGGLHTVATLEPLCDINQEVANAKLIAAAPDLLAACKAMVTAWDKYEAYPVKGTADAIAQVRAAIAKAEAQP